MNIIGHKGIYLTVSGILVGAALMAVVLFGFRLGIDFSGGTLWSFRAPEAEIGEVQDLISQAGFADARAAYDDKKGTFLVRLPVVGEDAYQSLRTSASSRFAGFEEISFQSIGPSVGNELRKKSITAIIFVLAGISLYIAFAFRKVYRPVSSWKYGLVTLITLVHDVAIPAGLLALLGKLIGVEIDGNFVVALLVVVGFSVHDTIVVFDRIRENLVVDRGKNPFEKVVNMSVIQTLARSINTSLTLILVLIALYFAGPITLKYFILTLLVGVTTGIYSSIFVASPLLVVWQGVKSQS